jgi:asparagine synthase (glutamine-hydrolysing)
MPRFGVLLGLKNLLRRNKLCGFAGFITPSSFDQEIAFPILKRMTDSLEHRGPDGFGYWVSEKSILAIGHRRLSILDLSNAGSQPMGSKCSRYILAFNGEIYNHFSLRSELEKNHHIAWKGTSDTETLIEAISIMGLEVTLRKLKGMFAFALWDKKNESLSLARDSMGEKPIYYGWQGNTFMFGSELKALKAHPEFNGDISRDSLSLFLKHNYVPAPHSIFKGINKLMPGNVITVFANQLPGSETISSHWSINGAPDSNEYDSMPDTHLVNLLEKKLLKSVQSQMLSDVPLGSLLSGGIDSSLITALMQNISDQPIKTFTIGFDNKHFNEAEHALSVSRHLQTDHNELYVSSQDSLSIVPNLASYWDEPFADSSQIPTFLVMQLASKTVKVALSGDGADELFGGYNRYRFAPKIWKQVGWMPHQVKNILSKLLTSVSVSTIDSLTSPISKYLGVAQVGHKFHKLGNRFSQLNSIDNFYLSLVTEWPNVEDILLNFQEPSYLLNDFKNWPNIDNPALRMMALDSLTYLPDDILTKVDRASMAVSIESRAPFLDPEIVKFALNLPLHAKIRKDDSKWILKKILYKYVPQNLVDRPKMGFSIPLDEWLRGPLRDWADDLLSKQKLEQQGFFNSQYIHDIWSRHCKGEQFGSRLWNILMFQNWLEQQ